MDELVCLQCGKEMEYEWAPCPYCGWKPPEEWEISQEEMEAEAPSTRFLSSPRKWIRYTAWIVLLASLFGLLIYLRQFFSLKQ